MPWNLITSKHTKRVDLHNINRNSSCPKNNWYTPDQSGTNWTKLHTICAERRCIKYKLQERESGSQSDTSTWSSPDVQSPSMSDREPNMSSCTGWAMLYSDIHSSDFTVVAPVSTIWFDLTVNLRSAISWMNFMNCHEHIHRLVVITLFCLDCPDIALPSKLMTNRTVGKAAIKRPSISLHYISL